MSITSVVLTKEQKSIIAEALEVMPEDLEEIKIKANSYKKNVIQRRFLNDIQRQYGHTRQDGFDAHSV
ncbi:hypothetical protein NDX98_17335 [Enterobacter roggenkampii]|nr:hypothetical protein [Enterobacter kobei]